jgi:molybdate transport system substrate-binding protein
MKKILSFILVLFIFSGCSKKDSDKELSLLIMCGAANKPVMEDIAKQYEKETGIKVNLILGGSGTLLSQIEMSKKGDIYLPGSPDYIIKANNKKLIYPDSVKKVCYLVPAILVQKGNPKNINSLEDLAKPGIRVGIGNPETVCLGLYGIELLEKNNMLDKVIKNVVTFGGSCSKTANLIVFKSVDVILGWKVFHSWTPEKSEFVAIDPDKIPRISYIPISIPAYAKDKIESQKFIDYVLSEKGKQFYKKWGYISDKEEALSYTTNGAIGGEYILPENYYEIIKNVK